MDAHGKPEQACAVFKQYKLEILGISEMRWNGFGEQKTSTGETFLFSGRPEGAGHHEGVGLLLSSKAKGSLISWEPISERILKARFKGRARNITIIQVYAPTEESELAKKDNFYNQLNSVISKVQKGDILMLMGDLNAKVGSDNSNLEHVMGKHGLGVRNDNGDRFVEV